MSWRTISAIENISLTVRLSCIENACSSAMKADVTIAAMLCLLFNTNPVCSAQTTNEAQIKDAIVSIQKYVVDLTDGLVLLHDAQFVAIRKAMTEKTARQIVQLLRQGALTNDTQADVGVLLISGLKERSYWIVTQPLLTTNTNPEVLHSMLSPPFPYGPGYANTYKIQWYRNRLLQLKAQKPDGYYDLILSGEDARDYADYLKNPEAYGYPRPDQIHP